MRHNRDPRERIKHSPLPDAPLSLPNRWLNIEATCLRRRDIFGRGPAVLSTKGQCVIPASAATKYCIPNKLNFF